MANLHALCLFIMKSSFFDTINMSAGRLFPLNERATRTIRNLHVENERVTLTFHWSSCRELQIDNIIWIYGVFCDSLLNIFYVTFCGISMEMILGIILFVRCI